MIKNTRPLTKKAISFKKHLNSIGYIDLLAFMPHFVKGVNPGKEAKQFLYPSEVYEILLATIVQSSNGDNSTTFRLEKSKICISIRFSPFELIH
jgi:hypothetical protein